MNRFCKWFAMALLTLVAVLVLSPEAAGMPPGGGGGGGGGKPPKGDPPPPPIINYQITNIGNMGGSGGLNCHAINDSKVIVGSGNNAADVQVAWVYVPGFAGPVDLNTLAVAGGGLPVGWTAGWAYDINNWNQIVGTAYDQDDWMNGNRRVFVFDLDLGEFTLFPQFGPRDFGRGINDSGTVAFGLGDGRVGRQAAGGGVTIWGPLSEDPWGPAINNDGIMVTGSHRYDPWLDAWETLPPGYAFAGNINEHGDFAGSLYVSGREYHVFRYSEGFGFETIYATNALGNSAMGINSDGDVLFWGYPSRNSSRKSFIYMNEHGVISLDDAVVGDPADVADFRASAQVRRINARDTALGIGTTGFGDICGIIMNSSTGLWDVVILTPVEPPQ